MELIKNAHALYRDNGPLIFYLGSEAWGNKTKEINISSLNLIVISFVLLSQASEPR